MAKSGYIKEVQYNVLGGAVGSPWYTLGVIPPSVEVGVSLALAATWENTGDEAFRGHIALSITDPNGGVTVIGDKSGQNVEVDPDHETAIIFDPFTLSLVGIYGAEFTLTEYGETTILDQNSYQVASVSAVPVPAPAQIEVTELMNLMITMMIIVMMMKMMTSSMKI